MLNSKQKKNFYFIIITLKIFRILSNYLYYLIINLDLLAR